MAVNRELDRFLESVERRAFVKARLATGNEQEALDIVQDAMFKLVKSYGNKAAEEWPPLFHRILQSRITDWYRRQGTKNRLFAWLTRLKPTGTDLCLRDLQGQKASLHLFCLGKAAQVEESQFVRAGLQLFNEFGNPGNL